MSVLPPRPLLATCLVLLGGLAWTVEGRPMPEIGPADAARWEGQAVVLEGWVQDVAHGADGTVRFTLADGPHAVAARMQASASTDGRHVVQVHGGDRVAAPGRLVRGAGGDLHLLVDDPAALRRIAGGAASAASPGDWDAIARSPGEWTGRPLRLAGIVADGAWRAHGHELRLGEGAWPAAGAVEADGFLRYDAACLCFAFDAGRVRPWTP